MFIQLSNIHKTKIFECKQKCTATFNMFKKNNWHKKNKIVKSISCQNLKWYFILRFFSNSKGDRGKRDANLVKEGGVPRGQTLPFGKKTDNPSWIRLKLSANATWGYIFAESELPYIFRVFLCKILSFKPSYCKVHVPSQKPLLKHLSLHWHFLRKV